MIQNSSALEASYWVYMLDSIKVDRYGDSELTFNEILVQTRLKMVFHQIMIKMYRRLIWYQFSIKHQKVTCNALPLRHLINPFPHTTTLQQTSLKTSDSAKKYENLFKWEFNYWKELETLWKNKKFYFPHNVFSVCICERVND